MDPQQLMRRTRRDFLTTAASGLGGSAVASMLCADGMAAGVSNPLATKGSHFTPRAKACISIFMAGAPSQMDLFDPKPKLNELDGKPLPESMLKNVRFAFIQKDSAVLMGTKRTFKQHGESGMWFSDLLPNIATCADDICMVRSMITEQFNHHPGQLMMQCGEAKFGLPTMGSWLTYGLGTENQNLPGYVVLTAGRGSSGGATLYQSGFLPSIYEGVRFRQKGEPVLNLQNPGGISRQAQRFGLDALRDLNGHRLQTVQDPEIASRIANYELAFRMQAAAPELTDLSGESKATLDMYGVSRKSAKMGRGGGKTAYSDFATNCLLARRMVERGVRFINIIHASWDHHSNLDAELASNAGMCDQPIAALIKDLKQRGLLDDTLVAWNGEFGRTPLGENRKGRAANTGRDHHPNAFCSFMAGGGVKGGLTYGETDEIGWNVVKDPVHVNDYHATLLHLFGIDHKRLTYRYNGLDNRLTSITKTSHIIKDLFA
jgi:hypothetical protein